MIKSITPGQMVVKIVHDELVAILGAESSELRLDTPPAVVLMAGLQGSGKTTTAGKLALRLVRERKKVLLASLDTRRPAAMEQLGMLAEHIDSQRRLTLMRDAENWLKSRPRDHMLLLALGRLALAEQPGVARAAREAAQAVVESAKEHGAEAASAVKDAATSAAEPVRASAQQMAAGSGSQAPWRLPDRSGHERARCCSRLPAASSRRTAGRF